MTLSGTMADPLDLPATPERLRAALAAAGVSEAATWRALAIADATPGPPAWHRFLSAALLMLGAALVLAGVISFFAFNWASLGRFGKFALIEAAIAACAAAGWRYRDGLAGQVALFAASVLVGPLLVVYGQTYQTGADPWGLFAYWALFIVPWAIAARFSALWVLVIVLVDVALPLFWWQVLEPGRTSWMGVFPTMAGIHALAVCAWEWQRTRAAPWLVDTWAPRLVAASGFGILLVPATVLIVVTREAGAAGPIALGLIVVASAAAFAYYTQGRRDLLMLTIVAGAALELLTVLVGRVLLVSLPLGINGPLLMAVFIIVEITLAVAWLRKTLQDWRTE
jgi:uncharacterized membrane protein